MCVCVRGVEGGCVNVSVCVGRVCEFMCECVCVSVCVWGGCVSVHVCVVTHNVMILQNN